MNDEVIEWKSGRRSMKVSVSYMLIYTGDNEKKDGSIFTSYSVTCEVCSFEVSPFGSFT